MLQFIALNIFVREVECHALIQLLEVIVLFWPTGKLANQ